jgi:Kef-type K+ transport system membrane component KefB
MNTELWIFAIILLVVAMATKVVGYGLGAKMCGCNFKDSLRIGIGMMARGEVALIMAQKGLDCGLLSETLFAPVVLVVLVTTLASPILLNFVRRIMLQRIRGGMDCIG